MAGKPRLKSPWPAFGGKGRIAPVIWSRLGDVSNYIEPFANSAAVLLARPHAPKIETLNDLDAYIANAWRALSKDPEAVAEHADWPVNECDLHARHRWLVLSPASAEFRQRMRTDPDYFDPKIAGWWIWGSCCWIGSGWCSSSESAEWEQAPGAAYGAICGVHAISAPSGKRPKLSGGSPDSGALGTGVHANGPPSGSRPALGDHRTGGGRGVLANVPASHRPQLADAYGPGRGVHATGPGLSQQVPGAAWGGISGVHAISAPSGTCAARRAWLLDWFGRLRDRLRTVRVCCGDWRRVCDSPSVTTRLGLTGLFLDPPYSKTRADGSSNRASDLYATDRAQDVDGLVADVRAYCLERGPDPRMRLVLSGYEGEGHEVLEQHGWTVVEWAASGGYGNRSATGKANARRERLWCSPHCLDPDREDCPLFAGLDGAPTP